MDPLETTSQNAQGGNQSTQQDDNKTTTNIELDKLKAELSAMTDTAKRALADLQNVQKRSSQERIELYPKAQADLMLEFLPVIDSFDRAFSHIPEDLKTNEWVKGVESIENQFQSLLSKVGLQAIIPENETFNPHEHEAMMEVPGNKDQVIQVLEKGYKFKEQVIRPAKVSVGNGA